jgi:hypothetical protein
VEQRALADTGKSAASELTALDKATAAYELTVEGAGAATGDFARTAPSWANSMKTLTAFWEEFKTLLGETLLPVLTPVIGKIKELAQEYLPKLADYIHEHVIPAIEDWGAQFDGWYEAHVQPFIDDMQQMWIDFVSQVEMAMGDTKTEFGLNMESLKATAQVIGAEIGSALGYAIGDGMQKWWSENFEGWWHDRLQELILNSPLGSLLGLGTFGGLQTAPATPAPNIGPSLNSQAMPQAVTINNYVDAQSRTVGEAARDGTLAGLRQAGMR